MTPEQTTEANSSLGEGRPRQLAQLGAAEATELKLRERSSGAQSISRRSGGCKDGGFTVGFYIAGV